MRLCTIPGCGRTHHGNGYCLNHYHQWRYAGYPANWRPISPVALICTIPGCQRQLKKDGYCQPHHQLWESLGRPDPWKLSPDLIAKPANWERDRQLVLRGIPAIVVPYDLYRPTCRVTGCDQSLDHEGYCLEHFLILAEFDCLADWTLAIRQKSCKILDCSNPVWRHGLCVQCYRRWEKESFPRFFYTKPGTPPTIRRCEVLGCTKKYHAKGRCKAHYKRKFHKKTAQKRVA